MRYTLSYYHYLSYQTRNCPVRERKLAKEIRALRRLNETDQYAYWEFAWSPRLERELLDGSRIDSQRESYQDLRNAWIESHGPFDERFTSEANSIERSLFSLGLEDGDRRHLAEAMALDADCFLTNDEAVIEKCADANLPLLICKVSDCVNQIAEELHLRQENPLRSRHFDSTL